MDKTKLVNQDPKPSAPFQSFQLQEPKKEPFRFDQKKKFLVAIASSVLLLVIFIVAVVVSLSKSGKQIYTIIKNAKHK